MSFASVVRVVVGVCLLPATPVLIFSSGLFAKLVKMWVGVARLSAIFVTTNQWGSWANLAKVSFGVSGSVAIRSFISSGRFSICRVAGLFWLVDAFIGLNYVRVS